MNETTSARNERPDRVLLLTIVDAARVLSIGRTTMYELVAAGEIDVVHIGRAVRVPVTELDAFVARQCRSRVIP
jgi:excisionase family DNA binding protein